MKSKNREEYKLRRFDGITLVSLVITIVVLIILAGVVINFAISENGIISRAQEAKKMQVIAEVKEKIGTEILSAELEAIQRDEHLEKKQLEEIISKYGELQEDEDTIILNNNKYEIKLSDIYTNTIAESGSYTENLAKIALLEKQIEELSKQLQDNNKKLYSVSGAIYGKTTSPNGTIVMPNINNTIGIVDGRFTSTVLSNKVTLIENQSLKLAKGIYTFESFVPSRGATWGAGYKVFNSKGKLLVDHTYKGATSDFETVDFELEESEHITIYWYRSSNGWADLTYYMIKEK